MTPPVSTVAETLLEMVPGLAVGLLACMAWYFTCRLLMFRQDVAWDAALPVVPVAVQGGSYDVQIKDAQLRLAYLHVLRICLGRGRPSDRLFTLGLLVAGVLLIAVAAYLLAIT